MAHPSKLFALLTSSLLAAGCASSEKAPLLRPVPPVTSVLPSGATNANATPGAQPNGATYSGHGSESLPKEVIARFAPTPLADDLTRKIQLMLDVRGISAGHLSGDGRTLYFTWNVTGVSQVWRLDGPNHFPIQMTGGQDVTTVAGVSPTGKYVIVQRDKKGEENPGLYWMNAAGGPLLEIQHLPKVRTEFEFVSADGRFIYFRANDVKPGAYVLYRYDTEKRTREVVFDQEGIWTVADHRDNDRRLLLAKEVGSNMAEYFEWNTDDKSLRPLFGQGEREDYAAVYGARPGEVLVITPKFGEFRRLCSWRQGTFTAVGAEIRADVALVGMDESKRRFFLQTNDAGYTRLSAFDAKTLKPLALPSLPKGDHVTAGSATPDGRYVTLSIDSGHGPLENFVFDWTTKKLAAWNVPSLPELDKATFVTPKLSEYPARDGTKIPAFVWQSDACARAEKPCPVIVLFHGGPEGQTVAGFNRTAQLFMQAGFVLFAPNVRGSDGYGRTWIHADDGAKRLRVISDIDDAGKFAREAFAKGGIQPKVGVLGGSYGGYAALIGMTLFAGTYDAGVSNVGISNLVTFLENTAPYRRILRISEYGDPAKDRDALLQLSPTTHVQKVQAPLLLIQGASDPRVPVGEALQIHAALVKKGVPTKLIVFADEGHGTQKRENKVLEIGHALQWFEEHLKK